MKLEDLKLQPGDWVFVKGQSFTACLIRKITFSKVSHVGIMIDEARIFETDIAWGKAKINPVVHYKETPIIVFRPPYNDMQRLMIEAISRSREGRLYSGLDIFTNFIFSPLHPKIRGKLVSFFGNKHFQICSEQVADITFAATGWGYLKESETFTPDDLLELAYEKYEKIGDTQNG